MAKINTIDLENHVLENQTPGNQTLGNQTPGNDELANDLTNKALVSKKSAEPNLISLLHAEYAEELSQVNNVILSNLECEEEMIINAAKHLIGSGGKRIRPLLTILSANLFTPNSSNLHHITLAAATEYVHTATLLHDDVVDSSLLRRFNPTVNAIWGNQEAILVGDYLFSVAFKLMVSAGSMEALYTLASASSIIAKGEVAQLMNIKSKKFISEAEYFDIIKCKTAELFGASCKIGAIIAGASIASQELVYNYGIKLGMIYQIKDDMLDYFSNAKSIGKNIGDDFFEGKITLPIIYLRDCLSSYDREFIDSLFASNASPEPSHLNEGNLSRIINLLQREGIPAKLQDKILKLELEAKESIEALSAGNEGISTKEAEYMKSLLRFASSRES